MKPYRVIDKTYGKIEVLAETEKTLLGLLTKSGGTKEYVCWLRALGEEEDQFVLGHYYGNTQADLQKAFQDFVLRASGEFSRDYVAVPKMPLQAYLEKSVDAITSALQDEDYVDDVEELNECLKEIYPNNDIPQIKTWEGSSDEIDSCED